MADIQYQGTSLLIMVNSDKYDKVMAAFMTAESAAMCNEKVIMYFAYFGGRVAKLGYFPKLPGIWRFATKVYEKKLTSTGFDGFEALLKKLMELGVEMKVCDICIKTGLIKEGKIRKGFVATPIIKLVEYSDCYRNTLVFS